MYDVIIIGGGPSGMMVAANSEIKTLLIEKNSRLGKKLLLTGGGRCNLTNKKEKKDFLKNINNSDFFKESLRLFDNKQLINYFQKNKINLKCEGDKVFLKSNNAVELIDYFENKIKNNNNVDLVLDSEVVDVSYDEKYIIKTNKDTFHSEKLVITTGGKSYPSTGSTGFGYKISKKLGHNVTSLYAGETSVYSKSFPSLSGQSVDVNVKFKNYSESGSMLFTHYGLSGEPILNISDKLDKSLKDGNKTIVCIDFLPNIKEEELRDLIDENEKKKIEELIRGVIPKKILSELIINIPNKRIAEISRKGRETIISTFKSHEVEIASVGDIENAIVTSGGIDLSEVCPKTYESKKSQGLYYGGEVLDLHGKVGGFNLSIAFISGFLISKNLKKE